MNYIIHRIACLEERLSKLEEAVNRLYDNQQTPEILVHKPTCKTCNDTGYQPYPKYGTCPDCAPKPSCKNEKFHYHYDQNMNICNDCGKVLADPQPSNTEPDEEGGHPIECKCEYCADHQPRKVCTCNNDIPHYHVDPQPNTSCGHDFTAYKADYSANWCRKCRKWVPVSPAPKDSQPERTLEEKFAYYIPSYRRKSDKNTFKSFEGWTAAREMAKIAEAHYRRKFEEAVKDGTHVGVDYIRIKLFNQ